MIPRNVDHDDFHGSPGEESVYDALNKLPDDYIIFHSVFWNKRKSERRVVWGEADFTVFHPQKGLLVIEVKSGGIQHCDGRWFQTNLSNQQTNPMKDPMLQAQRSKYTFIDLLSSEGKLIYTVETAVWFPSIDDVAVIGKMPPAYQTGNVLAKRDLQDPAKSLERIFSYYGMEKMIISTKANSDLIVRTLSPNFDVIPSISASIDDEEYYFNRMTKEQSYLLDYLEEQRSAAIQGGAGTGKTMLAIEKARRLPSQEPVLFLCFNRHLLNYLKEKYSLDLPNVSFYNLPSLFCECTGFKDWPDELMITDFLNKYDQHPWPYKHIIVDEGQDFADKHIELLLAISELSEGCCYVFFDRNQMVQQRQLMHWTNTFDCRLVLSTNCRNTISIAITSNRSIRINKVKTRETVIGTKPVFHFAISEGNQVERICAIIRSYIREGVLPGRIVILTIKTEETSILARQFGVGEFRFSNRFIPSSHNEIFFTTARKFKGLESDIVIIIDVDDYTFKNEENRRVFYVAASRARHRLDIVTIIDDAYIGQFAEALFGQPVKNPKLAIGTELKVKIAVD